MGLQSGLPPSSYIGFMLISGLDSPSTTLQYPNLRVTGVVGKFVHGHRTVLNSRIIMPGP